MRQHERYRPQIEAEPQRKRLTFRPELAAMILRGEKTTTWRFFDEKDIDEGDEIDCYDTRSPSEPFARIRVKWWWEKRLKDLDDIDREGHEPVGSLYDLLKTLRGYYPQ